jgi:transcriptional regulator with XRE-family HTH domain
VTPEQAFGVTLKELRAASGISQGSLALEVDLDRTYISLLERGRRQPSLKTIIVLSQYLGVSPGQMIDATMEKVAT